MNIKNCFLNLCSFPHQVSNFTFVATYKGALSIILHLFFNLKFLWNYQFNFFEIMLKAAPSEWLSQIPALPHISQLLLISLFTLVAMIFFAWVTLKKETFAGRNFAVSGFFAKSLFPHFISKSFNQESLFREMGLLYRFYQNLLILLNFITK